MLLASPSRIAEKLDELYRPEKALDRLEALMKVPYYLSPGWLRIDPNFDPLRGHPRFEKLVER